MSRKHSHEEFMELICMMAKATYEMQKALYGKSLLPENYADKAIKDWEEELSDNGFST